MIRTIRAGWVETTTGCAGSPDESYEVELPDDAVIVRWRPPSRVVYYYSPAEDR